MAPPGGQPQNNFSLSHISISPRETKIYFHFRGKTIEPHIIAEMAKTDTVERLIRQGQQKMTDEVQKVLLYQINGKSF